MNGSIRDLYRLALCSTALGIRMGEEFGLIDVIDSLPPYKHYYTYRLLGG